MRTKTLVLILIPVLLFSLLMVQQVIAQEIDTEDEEIGILPDSPWYFLKIWRENIQTFFTFNQTKKAKLELRWANRRLAELEKLTEKGKYDIVEKLASRFQSKIERSVQRTEKIEEKGVDVEELINKLKENNLRQQEVLGEVLDKAPEEAHEGLLNAMEKSSFGLENAIEKVQSAHEKDQFKGKLKDKVNGLDISEKNRSKIKQRLNLDKGTEEE